MSLTANVEGLEELIARLGTVKFNEIARRHMERAGMVIEASAKQASPTDTGLLHTSITHATEESDEGTVQTVVGTNVFYAPYMEYGTGVFAEGEGGTGERHWPPGDALGVWAERHGFESGAEVAFIIGRRGGLQPRRFMRDALDEFKPRFPELVAAIKKSILEHFGK